MISRPMDSQPTSETVAAAAVAVENEGSLLIPPNPAILAQQPRGSILINRNDASCVTPSTANSLKSPANASSVLSNVKNAFLFGETSRPRQPRPPAAVFNNRNRASSASSTASTASSGSYSGMAPQSIPGRRRAPSPSVSFAPLPQVPNLERTRSISLGVAARSNMLKTQGGAAGRMGSGSSYNGAALPRKDGMRGYLMMTDEEWEYYKKEKTDTGQNVINPPEIHHLVRDSGKKLWQKARSLSSTSSKSSPSPTARARTLDPQADDASTTSSERFSPPDSLDDQSGDLNLAASHSRGRPGLFGRSRSSSSSPHSEIPEYAVDESSEIGSIAEEDEEAVEDEDEKHRILPLQNRYLDTDGYKPRAESTSTMSDGRSSAGESSYNSNEEEDEDEPPVNLPAYLQKDIGAERRHYMHEHAAIESASGNQTRHHSNSGTATPTATAFNHEKHYPHMSPMSQFLSDGESHQNHLHHAHITKHLMDMNLGNASNRAGYVEGEGDATPRMPGSPKAASMYMSRMSEDTV
ncbi:hypothetical protein QFC21_002891 [Naganishia friedmannii]|uniref:Uncharacterized protein n=1 Tax=Naganishia friedmannii TaxID=89922 RepID=A0ACC2VV84_9TREE|nr:hypothetical protein QFC21_002891 [Naganishia friedmannii]